VTGATGQQGGAVARELLARKHTVRAMTRTPEGEAARALARQGAEVVKGDLNDAESLRRALQGAWGVFAVQNTWEAGVEGEEVQGKKIRFLRKIPVDPMTNSTEWGMRSMQDDPDSDSWGGQSVFDVYTKSQGIGLDGTKYKDW